MKIGRAFPETGRMDRVDSGVGVNAGDLVRRLGYVLHGIVFCVKCHEFLLNRTAWRRSTGLLRNRSCIRSRATVAFSDRHFDPMSRILPIGKTF